MVRKYRNIYRICTKDSPSTKRCLSKEEISRLLTGIIAVEEKVDGGVCGISRDEDRLILQGRGRIIPYDENSKQFHGLNSWAYENYEKLIRIPHEWIVYGEWVKACHNIYYDKLPDYFIGFDVWNGERYLNLIDRSKFLHSIGIAEVPVLHTGTDYVIGDIFASDIAFKIKSRYSSSEIMEGVVIKNKNGLVGKYVRREFADSMEEDWLKKPLIVNRLRDDKIDVLA